jgi:Tfp pilus assembly protein PilO
MRLNQEPVLREKVLYAAALICVFALFYNFVITGTSEKIIKMRKDLKGVQAEVQAIQQLIKVTETQLSTQASTKPQKINLDNRVLNIIKRRVVDPSEEINNTVHLLSDRKIARRVQIKEVTPGEHLPIGKFTVVPITVVMSGRYSGISGYISSLEKIERPLIVRSLSMVTVPESPGILKASILVYLYMVKA